jgi:hypothetical protein
MKYYIAHSTAMGMQEEPQQPAECGQLAEAPLVP